MNVLLDSSAPSNTELELLAERICELAGHLAAATGSFLAMVGEFDRHRGWAVSGVRSCAHWLSWRAGIGLVAAREQVRVARALENLPLIAAELAAGRLSYSKVRAMTRIATPATEADLVAMALASTGAQMDRIAAGTRRGRSLGEVNDRHARRAISWRWDEDGSLILDGRFSPEDGAVVVAAIEAFRAQPDPEVEPRPTAANSNADALVEVARTAVAARDAQSTSRTTDLLHLHAEFSQLHAMVLPDDQPGPRIEHGPDLHPETLRRLCCDSAFVVVTHHAAGRSGTSMDVGRRTRVIPAALRRAVLLRDHGCCRFPGCSNTRFVEVHHVWHWALGGPTAFWNLITLCTAHHHLVHEEGWPLNADGVGGFRFYRPDGVELPAASEPLTGNTTDLVHQHTATITKDTAWPDWYGEPLDLPLTVELLLRTEQRAAETLRNASAEAPDDHALN
ncbi:MAG TPA: DUF222 domain-containing protein [Sporichthyaceae bacterium]